MHSLTKPPTANFPSKTQILLHINEKHPVCGTKETIAFIITSLGRPLVGGNVTTIYIGVHVGQHFSTS
jgi:hypothetical protein